MERWRRNRQFLVLVAEAEEVEEVGQQGAGEDGASAPAVGCQAAAVPAASLGLPSPAAPSLASADDDMGYPSVPSPSQTATSPTGCASGQPADVGPYPGQCVGGAAGPGGPQRQQDVQRPDSRQCGGGGVVVRRRTIVGCATLSLMQPEALLPPPFPSAKPFRLYVANMAVLPGYRRLGLARRLLQRCERVGECGPGDGVEVQGLGIELGVAPVVGTRVLVGAGG